MAGWSLEKSAKSIGMSKTNLRRIFLEKCGDVIDQNFNDPRFKIHERIPTQVPRLLPQEKIDAINKALILWRSVMENPVMVDEGRSIPAAYAMEYSTPEEYVSGDAKRQLKNTLEHVGFLKFLLRE